MSDADTNDEPQEQEQVQNLPAVQEDRPHRTPILAGHPVRAIVPQDFDGAWRIATLAVRGGLAVRGLETPEKCMVAIMHGMEVGLTPMAAIQSIAVINGRPTIYGDGAIGLVRGSGKCEWIKEFYSGTFPNDDYTAHCHVKRKGDPEIIKGEFSVLDAKQAGLWDIRARVKRFKRGGNESYEVANDATWFKYPKRMLKHRARWALRDGFADVLKGLSLREEIEDMIPHEEAPAEHIEQQSERRLAPPPPTDEAKKEDPITSGETLRRAPAPPPAEEKIDETEWLTSLENAFSACEAASDLGEAQQKHMTPMKGKVSDASWKAADTKLRSNLKRIETAE
jgi:hypothetical protein